jgi:hypothetical protein
MHAFYFNWAENNNAGWDEQDRSEMFLSQGWSYEEFYQIWRTMPLTKIETGLQS